mmetsp:Transcript_165777/g.532331  ORF Transcript_165777/g.532331 Transcript_165777/m.532331 type:complete len:246 (-) Transcript_165777:479-1216(-)
MPRRANPESRSAHAAKLSFCTEPRLAWTSDQVSLGSKCPPADRTFTKWHVDDADKGAWLDAARRFRFTMTCSIMPARNVAVTVALVDIQPPSAAAYFATATASVDVSSESRPSRAPDHRRPSSEALRRPQRWCAQRSAAACEGSKTSHWVPPWWPLDITACSRISNACPHAQPTSAYANATAAKSDARAVCKETRKVLGNHSRQNCPSSGCARARANANAEVARTPKGNPMLVELELVSTRFQEV